VISYGRAKAFQLSYVQDKHTDQSEAPNKFLVMFLSLSRRDEVLADGLKLRPG
jgi:hypothetical protein